MDLCTYAYNVHKDAGSTLFLQMISHQRGNDKLVASAAGYNPQHMQEGGAARWWRDTNTKYR